MISTQNSLGYASSPTKKYWCHKCRKEFSKIYIENIDIQCSYCGGTFCEELECDDQSSNEHPSNFRPFDSNAGRNNNRRNISAMFFSRGIRPRTTSNLLDMIIEYLAGQNEEDDLEDIIKRYELMKKEVEEKRDSLREKLLKAMEDNSIRSFENERIKVSYVDPIKRISIDSTRLKKELPEIAEKYSKETVTKASLRITLKGEK